ncbi:MAG: AbrB/MazE/SpoVT family DNA-binding domain-containing protein [Rhodocyclaceae bacterium]|nr:AbrB/MazE/SpoVT family DNA-binding domain-containing protein [Rhodocyclaceae bacterium]
MQVAKWGNSLAVRLPATIIKTLKLKAGDSIDIHIANERTFNIVRSASPNELLTSLRKYRGCLPANFKFDRLAAHERS